MMVRQALGAARLTLLLDASRADLGAGFGASPMSFPAARPGGGAPSTGAATAAAQHGGAGGGGPAATPHGGPAAKVQTGARPLAARSRFSIAGHTPLGSPAANSAASSGSPAAAAAAAYSGGSAGSGSATGGLTTANGMLRGSAVLRQGAAQDGAGQLTMSGRQLPARR
jgi:hypothetical protein